MKGLREPCQPDLAHEKLRMKAEMRPLPRMMCLRTAKSALQEPSNTDKKQAGNT